MLTFTVTGVLLSGIADGDSSDWLRGQVIYINVITSSLISQTICSLMYTVPTYICVCVCVYVCGCECGWGASVCMCVHVYEPSVPVSAPTIEPIVFMIFAWESTLPVLSCMKRLTL